MRASIVAVLLAGSLAPRPCETAASGAQSVRFAVQRGTVLRKTFGIESKATIRDMTTTVGGVVQNGGDVASKNIYAEQSRRLVVLDRYGEEAGGRPEQLYRTYEQLSGEKLDRMPLMSGGEPEQKKISSDLEGKTARFDWNEVSQGFSASIEGESEVDPKGLAEDMDLRVFLPGKDVKPGDTWKIDAASFDEIFTLGGDLGMDEGANRSFERQLAEILQGDIDVTYEALDERGQATLAIEADLPFDGRIPDQRSGTPMNVKGDVTMKGRLVWDVEGGHFRRFDLGSRMDLSMRVEPPNQRKKVEIEMDMRLEVRVSGDAAEA